MKLYSRPASTTSRPIMLLAFENRIPPRPQPFWSWAAISDCIREVGMTGFVTSVGHLVAVASGDSAISGAGKHSRQLLCRGRR